MDRWLRFFFGTPQRFATTLLAIAAVSVVIVPGLLATVTAGLVQTLIPFIGAALLVVIVLGGLRTIVFGRSCGNKKK